MEKEVPKKAVDKSKYPEEFKDFLEWRGISPTITIHEAFDMGYDIGHEKELKTKERKCTECGEIKPIGVFNNICVDCHEGR